MSADADKCYGCINHIIMLLLFLAIVSCIRNIISMLHPIQTMTFFKRTARGDSTTFIGGEAKTTHFKDSVKAMVPHWRAGSCLAPS
jgi:hypothetical protein